MHMYLWAIRQLSLQTKFTHEGIDGCPSLSMEAMSATTLSALVNLRARVCFVRDKKLIGGLYGMPK